jgi:hypothetical protein
MAPIKYHATGSLLPPNPISDLIDRAKTNLTNLVGRDRLGDEESGKAVAGTFYDSSGDFSSRNTSFYSSLKGDQESCSSSSASTDGRA